MPQVIPQVLPHDTYMEKVANALEVLGVKPSTWWTEAPDGRELDGVFRFDDPRIKAEWPEGIYLAWDQGRGWGLITEGSNRDLYSLDDHGTYSHPHAVALTVKEMLLGESVLPVVDAPWDGDQETWQAVATWEAED